MRAARVSGRRVWITRSIIGRNLFPLVVLSRRNLIRRTDFGARFDPGLPKLPIPDLTGSDHVA